MTAPVIPAAPTKDNLEPKNPFIISASKLELPQQQHSKQMNPYATTFKPESDYDESSTREAQQLNDGAETQESKQNRKKRGKNNKKQ